MTGTDRGVETMQRVQPPSKLDDAAQHKAAPSVHQLIVGVWKRDQPDLRDFPVTAR
jgi:hypothetical protein